MNNNQNSDYEYFIDQLAELVLEYHTSNKKSEIQQD